MLCTDTCAEEAKRSRFRNDEPCHSVALRKEELANNPECRRLPCSICATVLLNIDGRWSAWLSVLQQLRSGWRCERVEI